MLGKRPSRAYIQVGLVYVGVHHQLGDAVDPCPVPVNFELCRILLPASFYRTCGKGFGPDACFAVEMSGRAGHSRDGCPAAHPKLPGRDIRIACAPQVIERPEIGFGDGQQSVAMTQFSEIVVIVFSE